MTRIVFVLPDMAGGGTERVVALLAGKFVEKGYPVTILLFAGKAVYTHCSGLSPYSS